MGKEINVRQAQATSDEHLISATAPALPAESGERQLDTPFLLPEERGREDTCTGLAIQDGENGREVFHTANEPGGDLPVGVRAKYRMSTNQVLALIAVVIACIDAPLDIAFILDIAPGPTEQNHHLIGDFYALVAAWSCVLAANFVILWHFLRKEAASNPAFSQWLWMNRGYVTPVLFLSMVKFDCMSLLHSNLWDMPAFSAPLSIRSQQSLVWFGTVGTVFEGLPQLAITAHVHQSKGKTDTVVLAMLVVNSCSLLYALLSRLVAGVVYVEVTHQKFQTTPRSRFFPTPQCDCRSRFFPMPQCGCRHKLLCILLIILLITTVSILLAQPHHHSPVSTCLGSSATIAASECDAFGLLHDSTGGRNWHDCPDGRSTPCDCTTRITCVGSHIVGLDMSGNNLEGVVSGSALSQMLQLTSLRLDNNPQQWTSSSGPPSSRPLITHGLHGSIPAELSLLTKLVRLNLSTTELVGDLTIFSTLTQLSSLDLSTCGWGDENGCACENTWDPNGVAYFTPYISGPLDALSPLTQLREIHLNGSSTRNNFYCRGEVCPHRLNHVTGSASALAHLTHLTSLNIANAGFVATSVDTSLCNQVTGEVPLWMLRDSERVSINVADNLVALPYDIGKLLHTSKPSSLDVEGWGLIGPLPPSLGELTSLRRLSLSYNGFSGKIGLLSTLTQLTSLDVSGGAYHFCSSDASSNNFSGELPLWMLRKNLTDQMELRLHDTDDSCYYVDSNRFKLPHDIGSLNGTAIKEELDLSNQGLGGQLPASIGNLTLLRRLSLSANSFSGSIGALSTLTQLTSLDVSGGSNQFDSNNFSGELPLWMLRKNLTRQMELRLHDTDDSNHFKLPHDIGSLNGTAIKEELDLSNQGLRGQLPASIGNLTLLRWLSLSRNGFSGSIGPLSMLTGLEALGLGCIDRSTVEYPVNGCGMVTGSLAMLSRLSQLRSLDLSGQGVGGPLEGLSHLTKLTSLVLAYNQAISGTIPPSFVQFSQLATLRLQCCRLTGNVPALAVLARSPGYSQQCELTENGAASSDCGQPTLNGPYSEQANNFSCPLPVGAAGNCMGWCSPS
jgi:hypothetical protein